MATLTTVTENGSELDGPIYDVEENFILSYVVTNKTKLVRSHERADLETLQLRQVYLEEFPHLFSDFQISEVGVTSQFRKPLVVFTDLDNSMEFSVG